ncbi:MAG: hypothetical protein HYV51_01280 [Parcubacteria group bacterium]|nr:hypothetical protein [Parcubacteria group bacterium]
MPPVIVVEPETNKLLIQAVSETVRYVEEALVMVPLAIVPVVDQKVGRVA